MRVFIYILAFCLAILPVYSIENTTEQNDIYFNEILEENGEISIQTHEKTLKEKLADIYNLEVTQTDTPVFLMDKIWTKHFDSSSPLEKIHFGSGYTANWGMIFSDDSIRNRYEFNAISPFVEGIFKDNKADFKLMVRFSPMSSMNMMQYLVSDAYVGINTIPHHRVQLGSFRPPVGVEGMESTYTLPFMTRSQLGRTLGNTRKFGARLKGNYSLVDYDIGGYSSDTFWREFFPGGEFIGWVNLKPLGLTDGRYGKLTVGGGIQSGHRNNTYTVTSAYLGYAYKKLKLDFEWANASGYNGFQTTSTDKHAGGLVATASYKITPKIQVVARYDEFDSDKNVRQNTNRECSFGINYFIKGQALKLVLNYVFVQNKLTKDSHRILFGTQLLL